MRASAQGYPIKPVRLVTAEAGGGNDFTSRAIVRGIGDSLGQQLIVDNRGGAGGIIAAEIVARAAPDGYTLLVYAGNIQQLNREIVRAFNRADIRTLFLNAGVEAVGSTPEDFAAAIKADVARLGKVISEAGIREE